LRKIGGGGSLGESVSGCPSCQAQTGGEREKPGGTLNKGEIWLEGEELVGTIEGRREEGVPRKSVTVNSKWGEKKRLGIKKKKEPLRELP